MIVHIIHLYRQEPPDHGVYGVVEDVASGTEYPFASSNDLWRILQRLLPACQGGAEVRGTADPCRQGGDGNMS